MYCVRKHLQQWLYTSHHRINSYPITFALASVNLMQFQLDLGGFSFASSIRLSQQGRKPGWFGWAAQSSTGHFHCPSLLPTCTLQEQNSRAPEKTLSQAACVIQKDCRKKSRDFTLPLFQFKKIKKRNKET